MSDISSYIGVTGMPDAGLQDDNTLPPISFEQSEIPLALAEILREVDQNSDTFIRLNEPDEIPQEVKPTAENIRVGMAEANLEIYLSNAPVNTFRFEAVRLFALANLNRIKLQRELRRLQEEHLHPEDRAVFGALRGYPRRKDDRFFSGINHFYAERKVGLPPSGDILMDNELKLQQITNDGIVLQSAIAKLLSYSQGYQEYERITELFHALLHAYTYNDDAAVIVINKRRIRKEEIFPENYIELVGMLNRWVDYKRRLRQKELTPTH